MSPDIIFIRPHLIVPYTGSDLSMFDRAFLLKKFHNLTVTFHCLVMISKAEGTSRLLANLGISLTCNSKDLLRYKFKGIEVVIHLTEFDPELKLQEAAEYIKNIVLEISSAIVFYDIRNYAACAALYGFSKKIAFLTEFGFLRKSTVAGLPESISDAVLKLHADPGVLIVATEFLRAAYFEEWNYSPDVLTETIDVERFSSVIGKQRKNILCMHPYTHKGIYYIVELAKKYPEYQFLVAAGAGPDYRKWKQELMSHTNIELRPFQTDILSYYSESLLILALSVCEDNHPRVIVEAMAMGLPVIAHDVGGISEVLNGAGKIIKISADEKISPTKDHLDLISRILIQALQAENYSDLCRKSLDRVSQYTQARNRDLDKFVKEYIS